MSDASDKLDRNRQAILDYVARRERRHDPHEEPPRARAAGSFADPAAYADSDEEEPPDPGSGWMGHLLHALRTWWRYHPAHMAVDLAEPLLQKYAQRKPMQMLGVSFAAGALLMLARPWKLISVTTVIVALLKSSQLSNLFTAAMSAADYRKDQQRPD
ncbi:hypothetical protein JJB11_21055 [Ramlibacter ginsenosidimutans]|uniref:Uncharacterized protein n=1 Tax=Ramlibacter ginsenosidimutans TaxID=502333 RepID=A0A934WPN8_9BURK|nr:hypothetical protein [Ramlibacter ginsenosidimutans]MBK6008598.1 hypothetical protein [Ramlibacter ginsenosidimutans]